MDQKLRHRRLNQLYADIDLPAFNPVEPSPQIGRDLESLPSLDEEQGPIVLFLPETDPIESPDSNETAEVVAVPTLLPIADPGPEIVSLPDMNGIEATDPNENAQIPDVPTLSLVVLPEADQIELVNSNEPVPAVDVSTVPLAVDPIPLSLVPEPQAAAQTQSTSSSLRPLKTGEPRQADWKAIGIGAVTGSLVSGIVLLVTSQMHFFNNEGRLALWGGEMFLGIIGALIANSWRSTVRELWRAAITWTLYPVWFALLIGFIILLLMFTSLTG